ERDELNLSRRGMQLQHGTAAVQIAFRRHFARPVIAFGDDPDSRKLAADRVFTGGDVDRGMYADLQVRRKIDDDVTNPGVESGVAEFAVHRHELGRNSTCSGFGTDTVRHTEAMNAAAAGLRSNRAAASAGKTNATSPGFY